MASSNRQWDVEMENVKADGMSEFKRHQGDDEVDTLAFFKEKSTDKDKN